MYVLADIGGTNIRFAAVNELGSEPTASQRMSFKTSDFPSLALALSVFLKHMHIIPSSVTSCICAVPGHVVNNTAKAVNIYHWGTIDGSNIENEAGIGSCTLLNDLECAGYGLSLLGDADKVAIKTVQANSSVASTVTLAVSLGTGLGVSFVINATGSEGLTVRASECGWVSFSPSSSRDAEIVSFLRHRLRITQVSFQHLCCGPALIDLYAFVTHDDNPQKSTTRICEAYFSDENSKRAVDMLIYFLGRFLAQLCLIFQPNGGIFLAGGLMQGLASVMQVPTSLLEGLGSFENFVLREISDSFPIFLVLREDLGLLGARRFASLR